ncbi:MAG: tetratricopeptide repeat protein [Myxococcales bacterium]
MNLRWLCACVMSLVVSSSSAWAQTQAADKAAAEALFDRGLALMREGNFAEACTRLEQSQAIEHGIGTMLYLAECYERLGRTASAWAMFREASSQAAAAGQAERADAGRKRADKLERNLSTLTLEVPAGSSTEGLEISRNGTLVAPGLWGIPIPVDPGPQRIDARAPGRNAWSTSVHVPDNGARERISVPPLSAPPVSVLPASDAPQTAQGRLQVGGAPAVSERDGTRDGTVQRAVGVALGAAGVVGLALGGGFGIKAIMKNNDAEADCPHDRCTPRGIRLSDQANDAARISNGAFIAGGVLVAAGAVLFFTAPKPRRLSLRPALSPAFAGLDLGGVF